MTELASYIWRDYNTDRIPSSGFNTPKKREIRDWGTWVEAGLLGTSVVGRVIHPTRASLYADLAHAANTMAWVWNDATAAYNGIYGKAGASGSGSWTRLTDLPYSFLAAQNDGDGSANAIEATTPAPIPDGNGRTLITLPIFATNTNTPVTVEFNGDGAPLTIKTSAGNDPVPGGLVAGMIVAGWKDGSTFRMLSDQASAAIQAAVEAAVADALAARDEILAGGRRLTYKLVGDLADDDTLSYDEEEGTTRVLPGDIVEAQGWRFEVAAEEEADPDLTTPALINLFVRPNEQGFVNIEQYGLVGVGSNDHAKIQRAIDSGHGVIIPKGGYLVGAPLEQTVAGQRIVCVGKEDSVIYSSSVTPHDVLRVRGTHAEVDGGMWRGTMSAATSREEQTAVIRVLSGLASIHDTRLLSNSNGNGSLITLDNWDPVTEAVIAGGGRYFHNIQRNRLGNYTTGYPYAAIRAFLYEIGLHATNIQFNHIISDRGVMLGGASGAGASAGNRIIANTIQSATGTISVKAGIGVDIAAYGGLDVVFANYLELYTNGIMLRRTDDTSGISIGQFGANTFDNCTTPLGSIGARRYVSQDYQQLIDQWNGWNWRYASEQQADFHAPGAGTSMLRLHSGGAVAPMILASRDKQAITLTANDQEIVPTSSQGAINGSGANRTGITIHNGAYEGQELTLTANTWGATIDNDGGTGGVQNCYFAANASSVVMGNASGNIARLKLKWVSAFISGNGCWVEESRLVRP